MSPALIAVLPFLGALLPGLASQAAQQAAPQAVTAQDQESTP